MSITLDSLPTEILCHFFSFCPYDRVVNLAPVCWLFHCIASDPKIRFGSLVLKYRGVRLEQATDLVRERLNTRSTKALEELRALLTVYPILANQEGLLQNTCRIAVLNILLQSGAEPTMKAMKKAAMNCRWDMVRLIFLYRMKHNMPCDWKGIWITKGASYFYRNIPGGAPPLLSDQVSIRDVEHDSYYSLLFLFQRGMDPNYTGKHIDYRHIHYSIAYPPPFFKMGIYFGLDMDQRSTKGKLCTSLTIRGNNAKANKEYCSLAFEIIKKATASKKALKLDRELCLQLDYGQLLHIQKKVPLPYWDDPSFWELKWQRDFACEGVVDKKAQGRERYLTQLLTMPIVFDLKGEIRCATFPYDVGKGFFTAYLILFTEERNNIIHPLTFGRGNDTIPIDLAFILRLYDILPLNFEGEMGKETLAHALGETIVSFTPHKGKVISPKRGRFIEPQLKYTYTQVLTMSYLITILDLEGNSYEVQFMDVDFLRGCLTLCDLFSLEVKERLHNLCKVVLD